MTSRNNDQGQRPAQAGGEGAANASTSRPGNGRRHADQGDLWSDTPATRPQPQREPAPERSSEVRGTPADTPPVTERIDSAPARERTPTNGARGETATPEQRSTRQSTTRPAAANTPRPAPRRVEPPPAASVIEEPEYEYDDEELYFEEPASMLRNPYVLAGLAVAVAIVLAVMVVFVFGKSGDTTGGTAGNGSTGTGSGAVAVNATAQSTVPAVTGLQVKSLTTATVHSGPGLDFLDLGLLRSNQDVQVVGRNDDASWYEIIFPPGSNFGGWVVASSLKLPSDASSKVAVAQPTPVPRPAVPATSTPVPATATPVGNVDIAISVPPVCPVNQPVVATISNTGDVALKDVSLRIVVAQSGNTLYDATYKIQSLEPGQSVPPDIQTNAVPPSVTVTATLVGLTETNTDNNSASCTVGNVTNNQNNSVPPPVPTKTSATATPRNSNNR